MRDSMQCFPIELFTKVIFESVKDEDKKQSKLPASADHNMDRVVEVFNGA